MTEAQVRAQLAGVTYSAAIDRYKSLKETFVKQYSQALDQVNDSLANRYINEFIQYINNPESNNQGVVWSITNKLSNEIASAVALRLSDPNVKNILSQLNIDYNKKYSELSQNAKNLLKKQVEILFDLDSLHDLLWEHLHALIPRDSEGGVTTSDLMNSIKSGLAQNLFYAQTERKASIQKGAIAGYFLEALIHGAAAKLTSHLDSATPGAKMTGAEKIQISLTDGTITGKIDTIFDEYFNFFSTNLSKDFQESIYMTGRDLGDNGFGAQVKLWNPPWKNVKPALSKKIGSNSNLYAAWNDKKSWINGVLFLENQVSQIFGSNVMYILGNFFYWTFEFISQMRANDYFLAFHHNGEKFTGEINIEHIDMSKPYDS